MPESSDKIRVDKWLWHARFFKSRTLSGALAGSGQLRLNGQRIDKPAHSVQPGDVLTFPKAGHIRVIRIEAIGTRRGPAAEAEALYSDLSPPQARPKAAAEPRRDPGTGRPTKRDRREIDALRKPGS